MPKLIRRDSGEEMPLGDGVTNIGRRSANEIQVNDKSVSRLHCRIEGPAGGWRLTDAGSRLGTYVNGRRTRRCPLRSGDEIKVGPALFVFQETEPAAAPNIRPLSESAAVRLVPHEGPDEVGEPEPGPAPSPRRPRQRKWLPVLAGVALAAAGLGALVIVLVVTRQTPEKVVRQAAALLRRRDGAALWKLVSLERKIEMTEEEFREQVDAVPNEAVVALESLDVGRARRTARGMVVPISITVQGKRLDDEVVLFREDGNWRVYSVPVERVGELAPQRPEP